MQRLLVYLIITGLMLILPANLFADTYSETVDFDPNQGYSYNYGWAHNLSNIPVGCDLTSAEIKVRAQVWYWGYYPYEQDILASDTTNFNYSSGFVCTLSPSTHPSSGSFYTITCSLTPEQLDWIANDNQINFIMVTFGGTYYLEYSTLEVDCSAPPSQVVTPTFNPIPGSYDSVQTVEISTTTPSATIYYTTNGDDPTESSAEYTQPIDIDDTMTLKARAYKDGWGDSQIAVGEYTINLSEINIVPWITPLLFP